jgi:assimilatory nitrate reductase catalytic subunit
MSAAVPTTCPYCGVGCGVLARGGANGAVVIDGDKLHPANYGRLCAKGAALAETVGLEGRLLRPTIDGAAVSWNRALDTVAAAFARVARDHGPDATAFYISGQLLTEDYYVANKLAKGFIGTANVDTNSRLCMASSVAGHKRAFGSDTVPGNYEDLEQAELVLFAGSNAAWCHPILYGRIVEAKARNPALRRVVIDPRRTATCEGADLHLRLRPGTDAALFNGLLAELARRDAIDRDFVARHTEGFEAALARAQDSAPTAAHVAEACALPVDDVQRFFDWFVATRRTVTLYSQGVNQSSSGTDKVNAIINCHLATGRIGHAGMGPFSLTGQPNAMGGREVGGLANQLAAHMEIENPRHRDSVRRFWRAPAVAAKAGLKAVEMFEAVGDGRIKAIWIMCTNPVASLPDADRVRAALNGCELVVVSECVRDTDTTACADVLLPALTWGEKNGTVTNSERRIARQRPFLPPPGEAMADWWMICEVAKRLGFEDAFSYRSPADIFREHAALSGFENDGSRDFDISGLAGLDEEAYDALPPMQWPINPKRPAGTARLFADGRFFTPNGTARFVAVTPRPPQHLPSGVYPLALNSGRVRDHWHTMTRTGKSPRLSAHQSEPFADLHPADASALGIAEGALVRISSQWGKMTARVRLTPAQQPGSLFVPMHWAGDFAGDGRVNALVNPACDPVSGQPELKHTPVALAALLPRWQATAFVRERLRLDAQRYWTAARGDGYWIYSLADDEEPKDWDRHARSLLGVADSAGVEWLAYRDPGGGMYRFAALERGKLIACLFVARTWRPPPAGIAGRFAAAELTAVERLSLLAGSPASRPVAEGAAALVSA